MIRFNHIQIDDQYSIETDAYNVILVKTRQYINKKGQEATTHDKWFYASIKDALKAYAKRQTKESEQLSDILTRLDEVESRINAIEKEIIKQLQNQG